MYSFETIAEHLLDAVALIRPDGVMIYANPAAQMMTGYGEQLVGMSFLDIPVSASNAAIIAQGMEQMNEDRRWAGVIEFSRPDSTTWFAQINSVTIEDDTTHDLVWYVTVRDITTQYQVEQRLRLFEQIVEDAPDGIALTTLANPILSYVNTEFAQMCGYDSAEMLGNPISDYIENVERDFPQVLAEVTAHDRWHGVIPYRRKDGSTFPGLLSLFNTRDAQGQLATTVGIVRDVSAQYAADEERIALQQQVIDAQQAALRERSTPLIPIADGILILPLIGSIDTRRAQDMTETLLMGITTQQAHTVIIDITGVAMVDTEVANTLIRVSQAVGLLGAQMILTGIRPEVAQTFVTLGVSLQGITTQSTLQSGVAYALRQSVER